MSIHKCGIVRLRLVSASPNEALQCFNQHAIILRKIKQIDDLTVVFTAKLEDLDRINRLAQGRGERLELLGQRGAYWGIRRLLRRPVLITGILFLLFLSLYLPTRVLFVQVEGNSTVPTRLILEQATQCGIRFGTSARHVRSEKMKNSLLQKIPQLQWAGINTSGCTAVISVREKTQPEKTEPPYPVSSMVAIRDGYVTEVSVTAGSAVCKTGQAVKTGQMLISAYTHCGLYIQAVKAKGEIFADTDRQVSALTPLQVQSAVKTVGTQRKYALILGKNQINFTKDSGISGAQCDRIKSVYYMTLPGGFQLPFAISIVTERHYETESAEVDQSLATAFLTDTSHSQLYGSMVAGKILNADEIVTKQDGAYQLEGSYRCNEMIGVLRTEEIMKQHE